MCRKNSLTTTYERERTMNEIMKLSIVEMELAAMDAKLSAMKQTMVTDRKDAERLAEICELMDKFRRELGIRIATAE